ncbi:MAG TPA: histidine kinase dimerization/phospho-acceptor domain-containing protein [Sphingomicrobium sp.]|nr:histidine kinase dimerization/phospho-acceptor domain-containing protein [Sphingomicrobium sp.]
MRFDDRLNTVLAQPAANPHDRAVRWRQLVELLARADDLSSASAQLALLEVRSEAVVVDPQIRAAAARAVARPQLPIELVFAFAADTIHVSAPVLAAASLRADEWQQVIDRASAESRQFIRSLHPDVPEPAPVPVPVPQPPPAAEEEPQAEAQPTAAQPEQAAGAEAALPSTPTPTPAVPIPSISEVLARIENLRQDRQFIPAEPSPPVASPAVAAPRPRRAPEAPSPLFRWECGPSGEIAWVEGVPRGPLIGRSLAQPGEHNGVDPRIQRAFAVRAPFRDAAMTVTGEGPAAGEWKLSGVPAFEPMDGRFAGYRGVALRSGEAVPDQAPIEQGEELDENALRELVHELKTPLNAIIGFAEIIDGQYLGPAETVYRERASEIVSQGRLLLSAIEDLDTAAQLRSSPGAADGATDLNALLTALLPEFKDRAAKRGAQFEVALSRSPAIATLDRSVLERLLRRFCTALIDVAEPRERLSASIDCDVGQCLVSLNRPEAMRAISDSQLFGREGDSKDVLASGFSLKLARGIAQTAGGDLRVSGDKLALVLPRRAT